MLQVYLVGGRHWREFGIDYPARESANTAAASCRHARPYRRYILRRWRIGTPPAASTKFSLRRVRLDSDGCAAGGAYWGWGSPLYWVLSDDGRADMFFRANNRDAAKAHVRETYPHARFYR